MPRLSVKKSSFLLYFFHRTDDVLCTRNLCASLWSSATTESVWRIDLWTNLSFRSWNGWVAALWAALVCRYSDQSVCWQLIAEFMDLLNLRDVFLNASFFLQDIWVLFSCFYNCRTRLSALDQMWFEGFLERGKSRCGVLLEFI